MPASSAIFLPTSLDTLAIGRRLGRHLAEALDSGSSTLPFLILLSGDLGAGKTTFCQGLCRELAGIEEKEVLSPTFTLANEYHGCFDIFHLDLYRLPDEEEFFGAGLDEYLHRPGLTLVEWPEKMPADFWPEKRLALHLSFKDQGRLLTAIDWKFPNLS